ncbi:MAG TPA: CBS domain-containing protein [Longimicrobiales bacterium]|nr:CBS domain-containing protein [Longimicrobiales bacterium]
MLVRDLVRKKGSHVVMVFHGTDVGTAVRLLLEHGIGGLPVVSADGSPLGFVAEREVAEAVDAHGGDVRELPVDRVMQRPAPTCSLDDSLQHVMVRMTRERLRHLVVLEGSRIAGILSVGDLLKERLEEFETEAGVLRDYVAAQRAAR